ncbi:FGGY family carbohydrate kinase, partial [Staphylococcus epidermidis]|uniref:FGGY family carbohydrate kinase n=1 Tax=Staphylococcus epidermidis TaxID=1282 RepID=UPI0037D99D37
MLSQSPQTQHISTNLKEHPYQQTFTQKTPLLLHPYFPPTKLKSILHHLQAPTQKPQNPHLLFPTIHSSLLSKFSPPTPHITHYTNPTPTLIFNIYHLKSHHD